MYKKIYQSHILTGIESHFKETIKMDLMFWIWGNRCVFICSMNTLIKLMKNYWHSVNILLDFCARGFTCIFLILKTNSWDILDSVFKSRYWNSSKTVLQVTQLFNVEHRLCSGLLDAKVLHYSYILLSVSKRDSQNFRMPWTPEECWYMFQETTNVIPSILTWLKSNITTKIEKQ